MIEDRLKRFVITHIPIRIWRAYLILRNKDNYAQELGIWEKYYPKGDYIVDIGATKESVDFFREHGAKRVYKIGDFYGFHVSNGGIKIDIEGSERGMIIETHYANPKLVLLHEYENGVKLWRLD